MREKQRGFTLIELVLVIAIIGIISAIVFPNFSLIQNKAKETSVKAVGHTLQVALESYYLSKGSYPTGSLSLSELSSLLQGDGELGKTPTNPFTGKTYTDTDDSGKISYTYSADTGVYAISILGSGNKTEILKLQNI